jgi:hypothetical protein
MIPAAHWAHSDHYLTTFYQAMARQADDLVSAIQAGFTYLNPRNADAEGLSRWEQLLGIGSDGDLESRRVRVTARLIGYGTIRKEVLQAIAEAFGARVTIEEIPAQYKFRVKFQSPMGVPSYASDLQAVYDEVKRATWQYEFAYAFRTWADWSGFTWGQLAAAGLTWGDLQTVDPSTV